MKLRTLIALILIVASPAFADYFLLGVKTTASTNDKQVMKALIKQKIDPDFSVDHCVKYRKKTDHTKVYWVANWDMRRGFKFTVAQANTWLDNNTGLFDNRNDIAIVSTVPANWEPVPEEE